MSRFVTKVDYTLSLGALLRTMTESSIKTTKSLDIICLRSPDRDLKRDLGLPSWAPDWRLIGAHRLNHRMIKYLTGQDDHPRLNSRDRQWKATGNSRWDDVRYLNKNRILCVKGCSLGTIKALSSAAGFGQPFPARGSNSKQQKDEEIVKAVNSPCGISTGHGIFEALTVYKEHEPADDDLRDFRAI